MDEKNNLIIGHKDFRINELLVIIKYKIRYLSILSSVESTKGCECENLNRIKESIRDLKSFFEEEARKIYISQ